MRRAPLAGAILGIALFVVLAVAVIRQWAPLAPTEGKPKPATHARAVDEVPSAQGAPGVPEETNDPAQERLNIAELRAGVRSGDSNRVDEVDGEAAPEDAEVLFMLIAEIPGDAARPDRSRIIKSLMKLLRSVPGEESSLLLMQSLRRDGFIPQSEWIRVARELAKRGHAGTFPYLESVAFGTADFSGDSKSGARACEATELLVKKDADRYVPAVIQRIRGSTGSTFSGFLGALASAPESANHEIGQVIPLLQERYLDLVAGSFDRYDILSVVTNYAIGSKSEALRQWVMAEVAREEFSREDETVGAVMKDLRQLLLMRLEPADR